MYLGVVTVIQYFLGVSASPPDGPAANPPRRKNKRHSSNLPLSVLSWMPIHDQLDSRADGTLDRQLGCNTFTIVYIYILYFFLSLSDVIKHSFSPRSTPPPFAVHHTIPTVD